MADLSATDPVALTVARLRSSTTIATAFGGPDHVTGLAEAPYPHIMVSPGQGGDLRDLRWDVRAEVTLEFHADQQGTIGRAELWRLAMLAVQVLRDWPDAPRSPGTPAVSDVSPSGVFVWSPLPTGQGRWVLSVGFTVRPGS